MANINTVWTITHGYGLSVYDLSSMGVSVETDQYFETRKPIKEYQSLNDKFKG